MINLGRVGARSGASVAAVTGGCVRAGAGATPVATIAAVESSTVAATTAAVVLTDARRRSGLAALASRGASNRLWAAASHANGIRPFSSESSANGVDEEDDGEAKEKTPKLPEVVAPKPADESKRDVPAEWSAVNDRARARRKKAMNPMFASPPAPAGDGYSLGGQHYDIVVIGSGPSGQKCAIAAAKMGKRVAVIDKDSNIGGVCIHSGTVPSKTFREAVLHLTGYRHQGFYGKGGLGPITLKDIMYRVQVVVAKEAQITRSQLRRNGIATLDGFARFEDAHTLAVVDPEDPDDIRSRVTADKILIGVGSTPARPDTIPFGHPQVFDADEILYTQWKIPRSLTVCGAGVIGLEYASIINVIPGTKVTVIEGRDRILPFADDEVVDSLCHVMRNQGARFIKGDQVESVRIREAASSRGDDSVEVELASGKVVQSEALLYAVGRQAMTSGIGLEDIGIVPDKRGALSVNANFQTVVPHIYAAGDVVGFPALASCSMEQGRLAALHMCNGGDTRPLDVFPYGIYSVPEISMVGASEDDLTAAKVPYEVGIARYDEIAKGQMMGASFGMLKLLFCPFERTVLGVHIIGEGATEIVHIGSAAIKFGAKIDYFVEAVFNYPTMAETYRVAALNGFSRINHFKQKC